MDSTNEILQIEQINAGLNSLDSSLNNTTASYLRLVKTIADGNKSISESAATLNLVAKVQKETTETSKQLDALAKQLAASEQKLKDLEDGRMTTLIQNKIAIQEKTKAINDAVKAEEAEEGSLVRMRQQLAELTKAYDKSGERTKAAADEINKLSREIGNAEEATNRHQRGVGGYADQLGKLPGPIGGVVAGLKSVGESMWALIANPIGAAIAAIVAVFAGLAAVFTSTASGGKFVKEVMAELGAVVEVLRQRTTTVIEAFKALFHGHWSEAVDLFGKSVDGVGASISEATKAAKELVDRQSDLTKAVTLHAAEEAKEKDEMQKLLFLSKDKNKTDEQRLAYLNTAMKMSRDMSNQEITFAQKQFEIDTDKAALTAKNSGLSGKQIRDFIALSDEQKNKTLETNEAYRKMWDLIGGSDSFKPLVDSYAKVQQADENYFATNKRNESLKSGFEIQIAKDREEREKDELAAAERLAYAKTGLDKMVQRDHLANEKDGLKSSQDYRDAQIQGAKDVLKAEQNAAKEKSKIQKAELDLAKQALNSIFNFNKERLSNEISTLEKEKDAKLSNTHLTASQKAAIEAEYTKKENDIKLKQAKNDKTKAMFDIAINTAIAATKGLKDGGAVLMALYIALGAIQEGLVLAQPLPKFAQGTSNAPYRGIFGEAGRELMFLRGGGMMMADKATYFEGNRFKGARIIPNHETERMISASDRGNHGGAMTDERILQGLEKLNRTIMDKPVAIYDRDHRQIGQATSHSQTIYLNRLTRTQS